MKDFFWVFNLCCHFGASPFLNLLYRIIFPDIFKPNFFNGVRQKGKKEKVHRRLLNLPIIHSAYMGFSLSCLRVSVSQPFWVLKQILIKLLNKTYQFLKKNPVLTQICLWEHSSVTILVPGAVNWAHRSNPEDRINRK